MHGVYCIGRLIVNQNQIEGIHGSITVCVVGQVSRGKGRGRSRSSGYISQVYRSYWAVEKTSRNKHKGLSVPVYGKVERNPIW